MDNRKSITVGIIAGLVLALSISSVLYPRITILNEGGITGGTDFIQCSIYNPTANTWFFSDQFYLEYKDGKDWKPLGGSIPEKFEMGDVYVIPLRSAETSFDIRPYQSLLAPGEYRLAVPMNQRNSVNPIKRYAEFTVE